MSRARATGPGQGGHPARRARRFRRISFTVGKRTMTPLATAHFLLKLRPGLLTLEPQLPEDRPGLLDLARQLPENHRGRLDLATRAPEDRPGLLDLGRRLPELPAAFRAWFAES